MLLTRLPLITSFILALAIGGIIYLQVAEIFQPNNDTITSLASNTVNPAPISASNEKKTYNIPTYKLFGTVSKQPPKSDVIPDKLPKTKLKLTLRGVQASTADEESGALIEDPSRDTSFYKVGDQLPGNATLSRVFADRVVIQRSGKLESLYFLETFSNTGGIEAITQTSQNERPSPVKTPTAPKKKAAINDARKQNIKDRLSKLRQRINSGQ